MLTLLKMEKYKTLLPALGAVERIMNGVVAGKGLGMETATTLLHFKTDFPAAEEIEADVVALALAVTAEQSQRLLRAMQISSGNISKSYRDHEQLFECLSVTSVWEWELQQIDQSIQKQLHRLSPINKELIEVNNSLEMAPFNGRPADEVALLERRYDRLRSEYQLEKDKLDGLYEEQSKLRKAMFAAGDHPFRAIAEQCDTLLKIVEKYLDDRPSDRHATVAEHQSTTYFSMEAASRIHKLCNGTQFENVPEIDFFNAINLISDAKPLTIRANERVRVCYLVSQLGETLIPEHRDNWQTAILARLGISRSVFRSKYREPEAEITSRTNETFVQELKKALQQ